MRIFDDPANLAIRQGLQLLTRRQQATMANIANVDTPGYKAQEVSFKRELEGLLAADVRPVTTHADHIRVLGDSPRLLVTESRNTTWRRDGNNVDVERELANLAETTITYGTLTQQMAARLALLRRVITDGRG